VEPEQAWQSALGQLQTEMPKGSFDTWVRDTRVLSYANGKFVIGVHNSYARDWLASRLASTANRLLMGMMNRDVEVQFAVSSSDVEEDAGEEETGAHPKDQGEGRESKSDQVEVEASYDLAYDEIVVPEHVTLVSRYFLRHLRLIGPELGWLYLGFRQAAFNAGARSGTKRERFSGKAIAALSGIAERTFWNKVGRDDTWKQLQGLVTTTQGTPEWDVKSATPRRLPRRYTVSMTLPLTSADAHSLRAWLTANLERLGGPEKVIEAAAETPLDELLPPDALAQEGDTPETVPAILRSLFGDLIPNGNLVAMATRLHKRIMPDTNRLGVTHFFVENILPHLGTGPGWMLTLLRDRCYTNRETGEVRDQVRIQDGYAEIAGWLGLARPKTIWEWLYGKHSKSRGKSRPVEIESKGDEVKAKGKKRGPGRQASEIGKLANPALRVYLREMESARSCQSLETASRTFQVLLDEIPAEILEAAFDEKAAQELAHALAPDGDIGAVCSIGLARFAEDNGAVCSIVLARFAEDIGAVCRVFKSLNYLNPITNDSTSPLPPSNQAGTPGAARAKTGRGAGNLAFWDFNFLMANNQVAKARDIQQRQKATGANIEALAQGFVSWLLYAYSPSGQRIEDPIALAAKRLLENVHTGTGGDFDRLAHLKPFELKALFDHDLAGDLWEVNETIEKSIYVVNYGHLTGPYKRELYRRLFGGE